MATQLLAVPQLWVVAGPVVGASFIIPFGRSTIGRAGTAAFCLADEFLSGLHAAVEREGDRITLADLGSTNGTSVNGEPLRGSRELRAGDVIRIGTSELVYGFRRPDGAIPRSPAAPPVGGSAPVGYSFGGVHGPVQAGDGIQYAAGADQYVGGQQYLDGRDRFYDQSRYVRADGGFAAGRDVHANDYRVNVSNDYDPSDEIWQGRGFGRVLVVLGSLVATAGFCLWMFFIFRAMSIDDPTSSPFDVEILPGIPMAPVGFAAVLVGGVLAGVGVGMSKAARKRAERRGRPTYRQ